MKHLIFLFLTYFVLVDCEVVKVEEYEEKSNDYIIKEELFNDKPNTHGQNDYVDQESQNALDFSLEDFESEEEYEYGTEFFRRTVSSSKINHESGVFEFDFENPTMQRLRALLRKEISKQIDQHKDPIRFTLNITPQPYSKPGDVLVITKIMDDNVRKLVQTNQMIKYLAEPRVRLGMLKKLKLEVLITPENKELKKKNDLLKKVCKEDIIPELKKTFRDMNFRFESLFNAVGYSKNSDNTARLVLRVFWRKFNILFKHKIKKILRVIKEKLPQFSFKSSLNKQDPMNPDKEYLILSFDMQISDGDDTTTQSTSTEGFTEQTDSPTSTETPIPVQTETTIPTEGFTEQTDSPTSTDTPIPVQTETTISTEGFTEKTDSPTSTDTPIPVQTETTTFTDGFTEQTDSPTSTVTQIPVQTETTISTGGFTEQTDSPTRTDTPIPVQTETTTFTEEFTEQTDSTTSTETPIPVQTETATFTEGFTEQTDSTTSTETPIPVQTETTKSSEIITPAPTNLYSTSSERLTESTESLNDATTRVTWLIPGSESTETKTYNSSGSTSSVNDAITEVSWVSPSAFTTQESQSSTTQYSTEDDVTTRQIEAETFKEDDTSSYSSYGSSDVMMEATTDLPESTVSEGNKLSSWSFIQKWTNMVNETLKKLINKINKA